MGRPCRRMARAAFFVSGLSCGFDVSAPDCRISWRSMASAAASTVMQHQILTTGVRWWARDPQAALFEAAMMSEKTAPDAARAGLIADIRAEGRVHGR